MSDKTQSAARVPEGSGGSGRGRKHSDGLRPLFAKSLAFTGRHLEGERRMMRDAERRDACESVLYFARTFLTMFPVKVTGGDCQEMLKLELLVGVKLVEAEPAELPLLDGMDTGAVA